MAAQYTDPVRMTYHQIVVDTYAVQHPDGDDPRAVRSVGIHLMTLCLFLERGTDPALGTSLHQKMVDRPVFHHLDAPPERGKKTILDIPTTGSPTRARTAAYAWAADAWAAWSDHHETVRGWLAKSGLRAV